MITKPCSRPNCPHPSRARGMCKNHYDAWRRALPTPLRDNSSNAEVLAAMPGTISEIAAVCQMKYDTVNKAITRLRNKDLAHIGKVQPPERGQGHRWLAVFTAGPGIDVEVPRWRKRKHALATNCARYAQLHGKAKFDPLISALFGARVVLNAEG